VAYYWDGKESTTDRMLHLFVDDALFSEADKWLSRFDDQDVVVSAEARNIFPLKRGKSLSDEIAENITKYREERITYAGLEHHYSNVKRIYEEWLAKHNPAERGEIEAATLLEFVAKAREEFFTDILPRVEYEQAPGLLAAGREGKIVAALSLLASVDRAKGYGVLEEGQGLTRRFSECKKDRDDLDRDFQDLTVAYQTLQAEYDYLEYDFNEYRSRVSRP
jgi:hypothetical protein